MSSIYTHILTISKRTDNEKTTTAIKRSIDGPAPPTRPPPAPPHPGRHHCGGSQSSLGQSSREGESRGEGERGTGVEERGGGGSAISAGRESAAGVEVLVDRKSEATPGTASRGTSVISHGEPQGRFATVLILKPPNKV